MGNTNCVVIGGPSEVTADILISNDTPYDLQLDKSVICGRDCNHEGWIITNGIIREGHEPPLLINARDTGKFSVSGRPGSAVPPKGKVFYVNHGQNLKVVFEWSASGWIPIRASSASVLICGAKKETTLGMLGIFGNETISEQSWNQLLIGEANAEAWTYTLRERGSALAESVNAINSFNPVMSLRVT